MRYTVSLPPSINSFYSQNSSGRRFKTTKAKDWESEAGYQLLKHKKFSKAAVTVVIEFTFANNRSDIDNRIKILLDLFKKQGIIADDAQVSELHVYKFIDKDNPNVTFEISKKV